VSEPKSDVGDEPTTIDFADEADGPFPGTWEFVRRTTVGGVVSGDAEPAPFPLYYRVSGGLAWFDYTQHPFVGDNTEQGYAAAITGVVVGPNAEVGAIVQAPPTVLDIDADSLTWEVIVALRADDGLSKYVGARVRAAWAAGVWTTPVAVEAIQATGTATPVVLASYVFDPTAFRSLVDVWSNPTAEIRAKIVGTKLTVSLNGVWIVEADVPSGASTKTAILVRAFNARAGTRTTMPMVGALQFRTLRDLDHLGRTPYLTEGVLDVVDTPPLAEQFILPLSDLVAKGFFKRRGGRMWVAVEDVEVVIAPDDPDLRRVFTAGSIVRSVEPFSGQDLVPCVLDLDMMRALREEGA
jgi:hypothetical protein